MRAVNFVEAVVALVIGAGGGAGFLVSTGDLKSSADVATIQRETDDARKSIETTKTEIRSLEEQQAAAAKAKIEADTKARLVEEERLRIEKEREKEKANVPVLPAFGQLVLKAASDLEIEYGSERLRGKSVNVDFPTKPEKFKIKGGKFTVTVTPKLQGTKLAIDVSVSPMAIIQVDGERQGVSTAMGIVVAKQLKLDLQSPAAGDLNLILQFRK